MMIERKTCKRCGTTAVGQEEIDAAFRDRTQNSGYKHNICNLCRITARTTEKTKDRFLVKARNTRYTHAKRFDIEASMLKDELGWADRRMADDMKAAFDRPCPECNHPYRVLDDLTLDISDPARSPFYPDNTSWMCKTCNIAKSNIPLHIWKARKRYAQRWQERIALALVVEQLDLWGGDPDDDEPCD